MMKPRLSEDDHDVLADLDSRDGYGKASSSNANSGDVIDGTWVRRWKKIYDSRNNAFQDGTPVIMK